MSIRDALAVISVAHDASIEGRDPGAVLALAPTWANPARLLRSAPGEVLRALAIMSRRMAAAPTDDQVRELIRGLGWDTSW